MGEPTPRRHDEDTQAILNRRRFLIESTLAGAGLGALAAGCGKEEPQKPQICLSVAVPPEPPKKPGTATPPQPCLDVAPPPKPTTATAPRPCLSMPAPQPCLKIAPKPKVCLSIEEVK